MSERQVFTIVAATTKEQIQVLLDGLFSNEDIENVGYVLSVHRGDNRRGNDD